MLVQTAHAAVTRPFYASQVVAQMDDLGVKSLSITGITAFSVGMVLALQTAYSLAAFGGKMFTGRVVAISLVRELGPVLTALMVGGRVGSGITAELGSMTVTEQVDALRSMAISPIRRLVLPRILAVVIMLPILTAIADVLGILGGLLIAVVELQLTSQDYLNSIWNSLAIEESTCIRREDVSQRRPRTHETALSRCRRARAAGREAAPAVPEAPAGPQQGESATHGQDVCLSSTRRERRASKEVEDHVHRV